MTGFVLCGEWANCAIAAEFRRVAVTNSILRLQRYRGSPGLSADQLAAVTLGLRAGDPGSRSEIACGAPIFCEADFTRTPFSYKPVILPTDRGHGSERLIIRRRLWKRCGSGQL